MDVVLRRVMESDVARVAEIVTAAFRSPESRLADVRRVFALRPEVFLLALTQGEPAGTVAAIDYGPFAYVGDMTVRPDMQHQGIGTQLMNELLRLLDARGTPLVLLDASEAGAPLYRQLGFVESDRVAFFEQAEKHDPLPLSPRVRRLKSDEVDALAEWDATYFGANRARVFRQWQSDFPGRAWVIEDERGEWAGYLFAQTRRLGPWVARRPEDAEALLQAALTMPSERPYQVIVSKANAAASGLLERFGFRLLNTGNRHMWRGRAEPVRRSDLIYGQASYGLG